MTPSSLLATAFAPLLLAGQSAEGGTDLIWGFAVPMVAIFAVFYFFIIRPQRKRQQQHQEMIEKIERGDQIVTVGGLHGTVREIDDDSVLAQVDSKGTKLRIDKQAIANIGGDDTDNA